MDERKEWLIKLGQVVKQLRTEHNMTQDELAELCGYTTDSKKTMISSIERGKTDIPLSKLKQLAQAFGLTGSQLFDMVVDKKNQEKKVECDLLERCHGKESYAAVQMFLKLDADDQQDIIDLMKSKLTRDKYKERSDKKKTKKKIDITA